MVKLQVYIADDCWTCEESHRIIADMEPQFPNIAIEMLNVANTPYPEDIFAVPTYVLNGRIISLGNPTRDELCRKLMAAQNQPLNQR